MGLVVGLVMSLLCGPFVGFMAWAAFSFSYRKSKLRIILELKQRVQLEDISSDDPSQGTAAAKNGSGAPSTPQAAGSPSLTQALSGDVAVSVQSTTLETPDGQPLYYTTVLYFSISERK